MSLSTRLQKACSASSTTQRRHTPILPFPEHLVPMLMKTSLWGVSRTKLQCCIFLYFLFISFYKAE
jgi:hypothetical protein